MSVTNTYSGADVSISATYTVKNHIVTGRTTRYASRTIVIDNLPVGAVVSAVVLSVNCDGGGGTANNLLNVECNGVTNNLRNGNNSVNLDGAVTQNTSLVLTFGYAPSGISTKADGTYAVTKTFKTIRLSITFESEEPEPPPEPDALDIPDFQPTQGKHIIVYAPEETDFTTLGLAVLRPTECTVTQVAGGEYSLRMTHPITTDGLWRFLTDNAIIKAPIPVESIPYDDGHVVADAKLYTNARDATRYSNTGGSKRVTYQAWSQYGYYRAGDKVTLGNQNYQALVTHNSTTFDSSKWKTISNYSTTPATAVAKDPPGTVVIATSASDGWLKGTIQGKRDSGYWKLSDFSPVEHTEGAFPDRDIVEQCFRIQSVERDSKEKAVSVEAVQLTYDWAVGVIPVSLTDVNTKTLANAVAAIRQNARAIFKYDPVNNGDPSILYKSELGSTKITADYSFQTVSYCVLDPDNGLVRAAKARLVRDLWSFYLLEDEKIDRGYRIEYGVNMLGVTWTRDASKLVTRIFPRAKGEKGSSVILFNDEGRAYLDSTRINEYPIIYSEALDTGIQVGKNDVTTANVQAEMKKVALKRFSEEMCDCIEETIEVDFLMLGDSEEYKQFRRLQRVSLYDMVTVVHVPLGLVATAQVKEYEWDAIRRRYNKITLGNPWTYGVRTVAGYDIGNGVIQYEKLSTEAILKLKE